MVLLLSSGYGLEYIQEVTFMFWAEQLQNMRNSSVCQHYLRTSFLHPHLTCAFQLNGDYIAGIGLGLWAEEVEMIPSIRECFHLMDKYHMLENIRAHSLVVAKVTCLIAQGLREVGVDISVEVAIAAALMHDIGKTPSLKSGQDHSETGRQICLKNHLDEIALIVAEHVRLKNYTLNGDFSEKEIVYYADKRVKHDKIVNLDERLAYIIGRYGRNQKDLSKAIERNFLLCEQVEEKLFEKLKFSPESLSYMVENQNKMCDRRLNSNELFLSRP